MERERYLEIAVTEWLPRRWKDANAEKALQRLGLLLNHHHRDPWLGRVMSATRTPDVERGLALLAETATANASDRADEAVETAPRASRLLRAGGDQAAAVRADAEYVYALHWMRRPEECVKKAEAVEREARAAGFRWIQAQMEIEEGICRSMLADQDGAQRIYFQGRGTAMGADYPVLAMRAEGILAASQTHAGNLLIAWNMGRDGLARYWSAAYPGNRAQQIQFNLSRTASELSWKHAAYYFAEAQVTAIAGSGRPMVEASNRVLAANLAAAAGMKERARDGYGRAERLYQAMSGSGLAQLNRVDADIERARLEIAGGAAEAAAQRLEGIRAQAATHGSSGIRLSFFQTLGEARWRTGARKPAEDAWQAGIELNERRLASLSASDRRTRSLQDAASCYRGIAEMGWAKDSAAAFRVWQDYRAGETMQSRARPAPEAARLGKETYLSYAALPGGVVVWVMDDRGLKAVRLTVSAEELEPASRRFARLCADAGSDGALLRGEARKLYDWLLAPLEERLGPGRILAVEPDGPVAAIPFQALMDPHGRYVGERFPVVVASSVSDYLRRSTAATVTDASQALVVAKPALGAQMQRAFPPLIRALEEGRAVSSHFRRHALLTGEEATWPAVDRLRGSAEVFHFAGHGFSNSGDGGLLLAPTGGSALGADILHGGRLAGQDWSRCRLAILSACSTGTGETGGPVNPESLVRGFLWAGVPRVVATRWQADAETSAALMQDFYSAILSGSGAAQALQRSASAVRSRSGTAHPYFWAGFQLFGSR